MHSPCLWVESVIVFCALPSLACLPPLSGLALLCFEDGKYKQHSAGGGRKAKKCRVSQGRCVLALGAKRRDCLGERCIDLSGFLGDDRPREVFARLAPLPQLSDPSESGPQLREPILLAGGPVENPGGTSVFRSVNT